MDNSNSARERAVNAQQSTGVISRRLQLNDVENQYSSPKVTKETRAHLKNTRKVFSTINVKEVPREAQKMLRSGAGKIRTAFDTVSQKLKPVTKRRQRLTNSPFTPGTPRYKLRLTPQRAKELLGRTPEELYSPFGIETPRQHNQVQRFSFSPRGRTEEMENEENAAKVSNLRRGKLRKSLSAQNFKRNLSARMSSISLTLQNAMGGSRLDTRSTISEEEKHIFSSPTQALASEVSRIQLGVDEFQRVAQNVVRRSLRQQMLNAK